MLHHSKPKQFDLFSDPGQMQTPPWRALPEATRLKLTELMARLIVDHVDGDRQPERREETDHDA